LTVLTVVWTPGSAHSAEHPAVTLLTRAVRAVSLQAGCAHMPDTQASTGLITESAPFPAPIKMGIRRLGARQLAISGLLATVINVLMHPIEYEFADTKPTRAMIVVRRNIMLGRRDEERTPFNGVKKVSLSLRLAFA